MSTGNSSLERAAEAHFFLRPMLISALRQHILTDDARAYLGKNYKNYFEYWQGSFSQDFFDMTTMIRLGVATETALRECYMKAKGHSTFQDLKSDSRYVGAFQRIQPWHTGPNDAARIFEGAGIEIGTIPSILDAQKVMLHRHLYAHSAGAVDTRYVKNWKCLTGEDILGDLRFEKFPESDLYWFEPLQSLSTLIESLRKFVTALP